MTITIYSKPSCVQCTATTRAFDNKGIHYEMIDVTRDNVALSLIQNLGYRQVPVVIAGDQHWSGFRPDMINQIAS